LLWYQNLVKAGIRRSIYVLLIIDAL